MKKLSLALCTALMLVLSPLLLNPPRSPGGIHPVGLWVSLLFWPVVLLSAALGIACVVAWFRNRRDYAYLGLLLLLAILPALGVRQQMLFEREQRALQENFNNTALWYHVYQQKLIPDLGKYVAEHPDRVSYLYGADDDRVRVDGFLEQFRAAHPEVIIKNGQLWSPWDRELFLVVDRNRDQRLQANGYRVKAVGARPDELIVGIYDPKWDPDVPYSTSNWRFREYVPAEWP